MNRFDPLQPGLISERIEVKEPDKDEMNDFVNEFADIMIDNNLRPIEALRKILTTPDVFKKHNSLIVEKFSHIFIFTEIFIIFLVI